MLDPGKVVIEILEDVLVQALKTMSRALDDFALNDASRTLIPLADIIKVD
ncbi:MAG: hypothetical protein ACUVQ6_01530 [Dissulfurimicrobium sp.]